MENIDLEKFYWEAYLLDLNKVEKIRENGRLLRTMKHEDIVQLKAWGPVEVKGLDDYAARKAFYAILEEQKWFRTPKGGFTTVLPAIYVRNKVDKRTKQGISLDTFLNKAKQSARA